MIGSIDQALPPWASSDRLTPGPYRLCLGDPTWPRLIYKQAKGRRKAIVAVSTPEQSTLDFNINGILADNFTMPVLWS